MRTTSSLSFYCRQSKADKRGLAPIEVSVVINGSRVFINLPRKEYPGEFKRLTEQKRNNPVKEYIYEVRSRFNEIQTEMMRSGMALTAESIKECFRTGGVRAYTLEDAWSDYLKIQEKRVDRTISIMCYQKYVSARNTLFSIIPRTTQMTAITPSTMQTVLAELQSRYQESTTSGIMTKIKTVITYAMDNGHMQINPFQGLRYGKGVKDIEYLTEDEIRLLTEKEIGIERLEKVRDLAIFQIASGMAYADTQRLTPEDICFNADGTCYIYKARQKTGIKYTAVVFPEGVEVLKKYGNRLPSISNQKGNAYLKEIQTICGLTKTLHFHLFRKTYATRLLNRGVRLEVVSKCLGHSSTQITQSTYGKLLKKTIIEEVSKVF